MNKLWSWIFQASAPRLLSPQTNLLLELRGCFLGPHVVLVKSMMEGEVESGACEVPRGGEARFRFVSLRKLGGSTLDN